MIEKKLQKRKKRLEVKFSPFDVSADVPSGTILLDCIKNADLPLKTTCGGKGTCGDCVVQVVSGKYRTKSSAAMPAALTSQGYALACQTEVTDNIAVQLPQFREIEIKSIVDSKFFEEKREEISGIHELNPAVKKIDLHLSSPTLEDNYSDLKRIERQLHSQKNRPASILSHPGRQLQ